MDERRRRRIERRALRVTLTDSEQQPNRHDPAMTIFVRSASSAHQFIQWVWYSEAVGSEELGFAAPEAAVDLAALHHLGIQSEVASCCIQLTVLQAYRKHDLVDYWSVSHGDWLPATVMNVDMEGWNLSCHSVSHCTARTAYSRIRFPTVCVERCEVES